MIAPGLWYQNITTSQPDDDVLEIGLASLIKALFLQKNKTEIPSDGLEENFQNFEEFMISINNIKDISDA